MKKQYTEDELAKLSGYTRKTLQNLRNGQKVGKYAYPSELTEGLHYAKYGGGVAYTEAGKRLVMERATKRNKSKAANG
ncbi:MAG: hypothetical protein HGB02_03760 [Chlorobiaceae bacterium]|nr:hypothetical protein [Chlorobiaceae bacterium]